jgi:hypothetical protein
VRRSEKIALLLMAAVSDGKMSLGSNTCKKLAMQHTSAVLVTVLYYW